MSSLCNDSVFNICLGFVQLQVRQWCVKKAWINNREKATGIPPTYQPNKSLRWMPVCPFACLCLRPEFKLLFLSSGVTFLFWPSCILKLVKTPSLVHEWYINVGVGLRVRWKSGNGGMPGNQRFFPFAIILHLTHSAWVSGMVPGLQSAPQITSVVIFTPGHRWPAWEPLPVLEKCCKQTQIPEASPIGNMVHEC